MMKFPIFPSDFINVWLQPGGCGLKEPPAALFSALEKPLKRLSSFASFGTGLKPGANENGARGARKHVISGLKPLHAKNFTFCILTSDFKNLLGHFILCPA
jgi:hypothetical protein